MAYLADQYVADTNISVKAVIKIKLDYSGTLKAELSSWRPQYVEGSGQQYLISKQEISSEVREVTNLCLHVTDESSFFVGEMVW